LHIFACNAENMMSPKGHRKYLRLLSAAGLLTLTITGCHARREGAPVPASAIAPAMSNAAPMPPLARATVPLEKEASEPTLPIVTVPPVKPARQTALGRRRHPSQKKESGSEAASGTESETPVANATAANPATGASPIGQLSADDSAGNPEQTQATGHLIAGIEKRLKKMSSAQRAEHKDAILQINSFVKQAKQALTMNDLVGAQTLANKAKILLDELR
jgi:hypothetical protein